MQKYKIDAEWKQGSLIPEVENGERAKMNAIVKIRSEANEKWDRQVQTEAWLEMTK